MKLKNVLYVSLLVFAFNAFPHLHAKSLYELDFEESLYLAEIQNLTSTGKGYLSLALAEHVKNWKEIIPTCSGLVEKQQFRFPIMVVIRPSGDVGNVLIDAPHDSDHMMGFINCIGENLMQSTYPVHPFPAYYFKFQAVNSFENFEPKSDIRKKLVQSRLIGIWKSETDGSYLKINDSGDIYYCLFKKGMPIKVVAKGVIDDNNNFLWGRFFFIKGSEILDLKDDLQKDLGKSWSTKIEAGVLLASPNDLPENSYSKSESIDLMCD